MSQPTPLTLLILAGGRSSRMGRDKAAIPFPTPSSPPLIARIHATLAPLACACLVAGQQEFGLDCQLVRDRPGFPGPLGGLLAGLEAAPTELVLAVAADLPTVTAALAAGLVELAAVNPERELVVPLRQGEPEPLLAIYRRRAAKTLELAADGRSGKGVPLRQAVGWLDRLEVSESAWRRWDPEGTSFTNCNTPAELRSAALAASPPAKGGT